VPLSDAVTNPDSVQLVHDVAMAASGACSSGASMTYISTVEAAFVGMTFVGFTWAVSGLDSGFNLLYRSSCLASPYGYSAEPAAPPINPDSSSGSGSSSLSPAMIGGLSALAVVLLSLGAVMLFKLRYGYVLYSSTSSATNVPSSDTKVATTGAGDKMTSFSIDNPLAETKV
jgi:hypothetical protein